METENLQYKVVAENTDNADTEVFAGLASLDKLNGQWADIAAAVAASTG